VSDRRWRKIVRLLRTSAFLNDREEVDLMDCFLIKDCIWNEDGQREAVFQYVSGAIEEHGYTVSFDFESIRDELAEFKTEIDEETKFVKDTRVEVLYEEIGGYYELKTPITQYDRYINKGNFRQRSGWNPGGREAPGTHTDLPCAVCFALYFLIPIKRI
jgi:MoxR-like ATPase